MHQGNAADFGDLLEARWYAGACASPTRGFVAGGTQPGWTNIIQFVTIQTLGNAEDWGDLTDTTNGQGSGKHYCMCNSTRGLVGGGETSPGPHDDRVHYWSLASKEILKILEILPMQENNLDQHQVQQEDYGLEDKILPNLT